MSYRTIGISLGNNTSAAVIDPRKGIELAISEERLNGEKNTKKFPINALRKCVEKVLINDPAIIRIAISSYEVINDRTLKYIDDKDELRAECKDFYSFLEQYIRSETNIPEDIPVVIERVEHHKAHELPAVYMSGFLTKPETLISMTYDGFGDGVCATIKNQTTGELLAREYIDKSLGLVYQYLTGALGFKEHQHEGKITGLAALGKPLYVDYFENSIINYDSAKMSFIAKYKDISYGSTGMRKPEHNANIHGFADMLLLKDSVYKMVSVLKMQFEAKDADLAASVQTYVEKLTYKWLNDVLFANNIGDFNLVLSGGLFANVKINYNLFVKTGPRNLFVLPPMGDEGTAVGAALGMHIEHFGRNSISAVAFGQDKLYLGTIPGHRLNASMESNEKYHVIKMNTADDPMARELIAQYLADNLIVCVSRGYQEFGPRALGNHSILYDAGQKETNDSLNAKLSRTEFMPFAPITLDKFAKQLFVNTEGLEKTLKYMTIAVPVKAEFRENYHAAYHVDYTARPQVLDRYDNPFIYDVIDGYYEKTGKKALINTSFNLHNHPIIFSDLTAIESFEKADLDVLVLDDKIIVKRSAI